MGWFKDESLESSLMIHMILFFAYLSSTNSCHIPWQLFPIITVTTFSQNTMRLIAVQRLGGMLTCYMYMILRRVDRILLTVLWE